MKVKIKKLNPNAVVPYKTIDDDFCYDLVATSCEEIAPNVYKYGTGISLEADDDKLKDLCDACIGFTLRPRSSIYKTGMMLSNSIGTIDELYRGEICAVFYHVMPNMPKYEIGDRIAQLHFDITYKIDFEEVDVLGDTERGEGGYGSTGK